MIRTVTSQAVHEKKIDPAFTGSIMYWTKFAELAVEYLRVGR